MKSVILSKQQSQEIAKVLTGDIKGYVLNNFERYFPWLLNEIRKSKGKAPIEPIITNFNPCMFCSCNIQTEAKRECEYNG